MPATLSADENLPFVFRQTTILLMDLPGSLRYRLISAILATDINFPLILRESTNLLMALPG